MFFPNFSGNKPSATSLPSSVPSTSSSSSASSSPQNDSITGRFDPSALERGAKALRELDSSPNASKAFDVTKLQELTKQRELTRDTENLLNHRLQIQSERTRIEADEKRKTVSHQQEQERITAQYKAQLEAEAYSKKLQDQQRQNQEWLNQQHQQFLHQEEIRKRNEKELLDLKKQQMREEKLLEKDVMKARIQEETKGKIQQERENLDVHLQQLRARAFEDRQTKLDVIKSSLSSIGSAVNSLLEDKRKRNSLIFGMSAIALGIYGARAGTSVAGRYIESQLGRPPLVRETSRWTWKRSMLPLLWQRWWKKPDFQEKLILPSELSERLKWTTNSLLAAKKNGTPYRHLLLYGHPGTGKTLFARTLARESGLDYAIMAGGDVGPLGKDSVNEVNKLFNWASRSKKGLILFIDEAEAFLRQGRDQTSGQISEELRNCLSAFLHHTGVETSKFCVILATNVKDILDRAVLDRIDEQFEFPLPEENERYNMIRMFFEEYLQRPTQKGRRINIALDVNNDDYFRSIAQRTNNFSGRQLAKLFIGMQSAVFGSGTNTLTKGLAETVLNWKLAHFAEDIDTIDRQ